MSVYNWSLRANSQGYNQFGKWKGWIILNCEIFVRRWSQGYFHGLKKFCLQAGKKRYMTKRGVFSTSFDPRSFPGLKSTFKPQVDTLKFFFTYHLKGCEMVISLGAIAPTTSGGGWPYSRSILRGFLPTGEFRELVRGNKSFLNITFKHGNRAGYLWQRDTQ